MNENRRQILEMLAAGKITADEAERLIAALESGPATTVGEHASPVAGGGATVSCSRLKQLGRASRRACRLPRWRWLED